MAATVHNYNKLQQIIGQIYKDAFNYAILPCTGNEGAIIQMHLDKYPQTENENIVEFLNFLKGRNWTFAKFKDAINLFVNNKIPTDENHSKE
jgi:hypothetical protein